LQVRLTQQEGQGSDPSRRGVPGTAAADPDFICFQPAIDAEPNRKVRRQDGPRQQLTKVFWFFSSEKNTFLTLAHV